MNYNLNKARKKTEEKRPFFASLKKLFSLISTERRKLVLAFTAIVFNAGLSLLGPYVLGYTIDNYVQTKDIEGVLMFAGILLVIYMLHIFLTMLKYA